MPSAPRKAPPRHTTSPPGAAIGVTVQTCGMVPFSAVVVMPPPIITGPRLSKRVSTDRVWPPGLVTRTMRVDGLPVTVSGARSAKSSVTAPLGLPQFG